MKDCSKRTRSRWLLMLPGVVCLFVIAVGSARSGAQHVRPVEVPRMQTAPVVPAQPHVLQGPATLAPTLPQVTPPPAVVVPGPPPAAQKIYRPQPKPCWCYGPHPTGRGSIKLRCALECCKGDHPERC